jgi:hypothetical protein
MPTFSAPNRIVWDYFLSLRLVEENARKSPSPEFSRQAAALAVVTAVTVIEFFLNLWFRVRVEERNVPGECEAFLKELSARISLDRKLKQWPQRYLSRALNVTSGAGAEFMKLKELRNSIVHFTSSHENVNLGNVVIHGLADTTEYNGLSAEKASWALQTAEDFVAEIFRLAGIASKEIPHALHAWAGRVPV